MENTLHNFDHYSWDSDYIIYIKVVQFFLTIAILTLYWIKRSALAEFYPAVISIVLAVIVLKIKTIDIETWGDINLRDIKSICNTNQFRLILLASPIVYLGIMQITQQNTAV